MDQQGPQIFWTNMVVQSPVMETNSARNPTAVSCGPPDDPTRMVTPVPCPLQSDILLDGEKAGAVLLFSGVCLALVGVTFTAMGWHYYLTNPNFEWTQLVGPILIAVGGTFILTGVCKFGIIPCWPCRRCDEEVLVMPVMEHTSTGHSFTLSGITQPTLLHGATTMFCIPPLSNFITQDVRQSIDSQTGRSVNGILAAFPPHDVFCVDNAALTAGEEGSSAHSTEIGHRRLR